MLRVGLYLENRNITNVDLTTPELGNPGCGGTEFLFVALAHYMATSSQANNDVYLFANSTKRLPTSVHAHEVADLEEAAKLAKSLGIDIFIFRPRRDLNSNFLALIDQIELRCIAWAHITKR